MDIQGFDWDEGNRKKCKEHGLVLEEIESLFFNQPRVFPDISHSKDEERFHAVGQTVNRRYVFVVFTIRQSQQGRLIRTISARFMHKKEIDHYEK